MFWQKLHGINIWQLNRRLTKMAYSKITLEEQMQNNHIKIHFKPKNSNYLIGDEGKREIDNCVMNLDGFELIKLCMLENIAAVYKEQRVYNSVNRWIEIYMMKDQQHNKNKKVS